MFQILPLDYAQFASYFTMDEAAIKAHKAMLVTADAYPAYPCRVSLDFAQVGERVLLVNYQHHAVDSAYASNYAIYVRESVAPIVLAPNTLPPVFLRKSPIAVRAFDDKGLLRSAEIVMGPELGAIFDKLLANQEIGYLHAHYAAYGCYAAKVLRA